MAIAMKIPSLILGKVNNGFDSSKYKNVELITPKDLNLNILNRNNKKSFNRIEHGDKVIEKINKLMHTQ